MGTGIRISDLTKVPNITNTQLSTAILPIVYVDTSDSNKLKIARITYGRLENLIGGISKSFTEVDSQSELDDVTTDDTVAFAIVSSAFGSYGINDILLYDGSDWVIFFNASNDIILSSFTDVANQTALDALTTTSRVAIAKVTTSFGSYAVNDILIYDGVASAWKILFDASDYVGGTSNIQRSDVTTQAALDALTTDNIVAIAKVTTAFGSYARNDILIYDSVAVAWEILVDASDYDGGGTSSIQRSEVATQVALDALTTTDIVAIAKVTTAFGSYAINDILIYDSVAVAWEILVDASDYDGGGTSSIQRSEVATQVALDALTTDNIVAIAKVTTAFGSYAINDILIYDSVADAWEILVTASDYQEGVSGIQRSEVATQNALDALTTTDIVAIAKVTTAFGSYAINDILIYDSVAVAWEILVTASDYQEGVSGIQRSEVATQNALDALTTTDRVAIAKVTTAFGSYARNDILIYNSVAVAWEILVDASDYSTSTTSVERSDVESQIQLEALTTGGRVAVAKVTTAFGSYEVNNVLIYDSVAAAWEVLVSATGGVTTFTGLTDTPASLTEGRYLRVNSSGGLDEVVAAPVSTERVVLYEDTAARSEGGPGFFTIALSRAPDPGRLLDVEIFFDGLQVGSNQSDSPQDRYNTVISMLLESDDFLSRPVHSSLTTSPTGSIPFKTTRDIQNITSGSGFSHTTIYIAKANFNGSWMRIGSSHLASFGSFVVRVVEYTQNATVTDGTETDLGEGTRTATTVQVTSSSGDNATLQAATDSLAGVMTSDHKLKLDALPDDPWDYDKKGNLIATSSTLATAARDTAYPITWIIESDVPTGVEALTSDVSSLSLPEKRPYTWCDGLIIEALVDGTLISDTKVLWGPSGVELDEIDAEQSVAVLLLETSGENRAKIDIYYVLSPSNGTYLSVQGDNDTLPADTIVKIYLAR